MARVWETPHYERSAIRKLLMFRDGERNSHEAILSSLKIDLAMTAEVVMAAGLIPEEEDMVEATGYDFGMNKDPVRVVRLLEVLADAVKQLLPDQWVDQCSSDSEGAIELLGRYIRGEVPIDRQRDNRARRADDAGKEAASYGMIASLGTPRKAVTAADQVKGYAYLSSQYPTICDAFDCAESWRMGMANKRGQEHLRSVIAGEEQLDVSNFLVSSGTFYERHKRMQTYVIMGISIHFTSDRVFVFDNTVRCELHDVLHSVGMWLIYGANHPDPLGESLAYQGVMYLGKAIKARVPAKRKAGTREVFGTLGTQIKKSYAALLAKAYAASAESMDMTQFAVLASEASSACAGERPWVEVAMEFPDDLIVDLGTVWNLLPGVDADPYKLAKALEEKMEAPKQYSVEAWEDFIMYSRGVISAHIIYKQQKLVEDYDWGKPVAGVVGPELQWAVDCSAGTLTYPPDGNTWYIRKALPWHHTLEFWHWKAQDVTHVFADMGRYDTRMKAASIPRDESNELLYAMKHAPLLSGVYDPADVRKSTLAGKVPGDRVLLLAAKRENTKGVEKSRDTHSGDDVQREIYSELEANCRRLAGMLDGCTSGVGRSRMETMLWHIISGVSIKECLDSMDFNGWSPNAVREWHMKFQDMLYEFFDTELRPSKVFQNVNIVLSKASAHYAWKSTDGSIQGFWGTGDTILNSLMSQWSFHREKVKGTFTENAVIRKVTLIDDILMRLVDFGGDIPLAVKAINDNCALLGYNAELMKTLMSTVKGVFLNRIYHNGQEVITAAKIFSKANREFNRQFTTVWDRVDSIFGSFLGASDRGADPVACYVIACSMALRTVSACNPDIDISTPVATLVNTFSPRGVGGWGFPVFAQWITRESSRSFLSGISTLTYIADLLQTADPAVSGALNAAVIALSEAEVTRRSTLAVAEDPYSISLPHVVDPSICIRTMYKQASKRAIKAQVFKSLIAMEDSESYVSGVEDILTTCKYPASVISEWASCLPHSVARSMLSTVESNEAVLIFATRREKAKCKNMLIQANKRACVGMKWILSGLKPSNDLLMTATECCTILQQRAREADGYLVCDTVVPGVIDAIRQMENEGSFKVHIPAMTAKDMFNNVPKGDIRRSLTVAPVVVNQSAEDSFADPMLKSFNKLCAIAAVVKAYGSDPTPLERFWSLSWMGEDTVINKPTLATAGTNPSRMAQRISKRNFSVFGFPNCGRTIVVDASSAIRTYEDMRPLIPFMGIVFTLKAAALLDIRIGGTNGEAVTREYDFHYASGLFSSTDYPREMPSMEFEAFSCALPAELVTVAKRNIAVADFDAGDVTGEHSELQYRSEVLSPKDANDILRSRGSRVIVDTLTKLTGAGLADAERRASIAGRADIKPAPRGATSREFIYERSTDPTEQRAMGLFYRIATSSSQFELKGEVQALLGDLPKWLESHNLRAHFVRYAEDGESEPFRKVIYAKDWTDKQAYEKMSKEYQRREKDDKLEPGVRFYNHYMAHMSNAIAGETVVHHSLTSRLSSLVLGVINGTESALRRVSIVGGGLKDQLNLYLWQEAPAHFKTKGLFTKTVTRMVSMTVPETFVAKPSLLRGLQGALGKMEGYTEVDIVLPAAKRITRVEQIRQEEAGNIQVGEGWELMGKVSVGVADSPPKRPAREDPEFVEFMKGMGVFDITDEAEAEFAETYEEMRKERKSKGKKDIA